MGDGNPVIMEILRGIVPEVTSVMKGDIQVEYFHGSGVEGRGADLSAPAHYRIFKNVVVSQGSFLAFSDVKPFNILTMDDPLLAGIDVGGTISVRVLSNPLIVQKAKEAVKLIHMALPELKINFDVRAYGAKDI